ncbi:Xaa-Pro peptidase family protein [Rhodocaloribacter litoris]|uniref:M24 family metallopeptidase n=1 Tax=Rhodocaloribacter litoris TaxID=2558931 RepID=UPI00141EE513|nr:Xaa-Pro peptidase family protein [Rhodocaloribacter litoris]QXD15576.1 Xaa-Pro peptidase family protein [Rhodocaloribacter litoris]
MTKPDYAARHTRLAEALASVGLDALALNPGPSLVYFTGLHFHLSERPVVAVFSAAGDVPVLVLPELEAQKLKEAAFELQAFTYTEDLASWPRAFAAAMQAARIDGRRVGVEPRSLRVLELRLLEQAAPDAAFVSGEQAVAALRMRKDAAELALMREATAIAQRALQATLPTVRPGVTEREAAATLIQHLLREGSDGELPFQPIVAFGPNSANPHAVPTDYTLREGDLVLFDWGANHHGYFSDLTRCFVAGEPEAELARIAEVVRQANAAGRAAAGPGVPAGEVDRTARRVVEEAGYGAYFIHRTGHGLGLEVHEDPYIRGDNEQRLAEGMTFTIEPGIYLPGRGGVRIEDDVVITAGGAESLSDLPRELIRLG